MSHKKQVIQRTFNDLFFKRIAAGLTHCLAIAQIPHESESYMTYRLYGWGDNTDFKLGVAYQDGQKPEEVAHEPQLIAIQREDKKQYVPFSVAVGNKHSLVLAYSEEDFIRHQQNSNNETVEKLLSEQVVHNLKLFSFGSHTNGLLGRLAGAGEIPNKQNDDEDNELDDQSGEENEDNEEDNEDDEDGDDDYDSEFDDQDDQDEFVFKVQYDIDLQNIIQIACGANFSLAMDLYGTVYSWGEGSSGALGTGSIDDVVEPRKIQFQDAMKMKFISAGISHSASISVKGELYTWGFGQYGQLGQGSNKNQNKPTKVLGSLDKKQVEFVSCGGLHTVAITSDGYAHSFGYNKNGQLGTGNYYDRYVPEKISNVTNYFILYSECGFNTTFLVSEERLIFSFGSNLKGRLACELEDFTNYPEPQKIQHHYFDNPKNEFVYQLSLASHFGLALTEQGRVISWGMPFKGCLGRDIQHQILDIDQNQNKSHHKSMIQNFQNMEEMQLEQQENLKLEELFDEIKDEWITQIIKPKAITIGYSRTFVLASSPELKQKLQKEVKVSSFIKEVKCGLFHSVALTDVGELWVWGSNSTCQHGIKDDELKEQTEKIGKYIYFPDMELEPSTWPTQVSMFTIQQNRRITYMATGYEYIVVVENRRSVFSWGRNLKGQCGLGHVSETVAVPTKIQDLEGMLVQQIACGEDHTLVLNVEGQVFAFGSPTDGKLGVGIRQTPLSTPMRIDNFNKDIKIKKIAVGPHHSLALAEDPFKNDRVIPLQIEENVKTYQKENDKYVIYSWGNGYGGKLGHGNQDNQYYPKIIQTKFTFQDISAGTHHSGAISSDDVVIVWGIGSYLGMSKPEENDEAKQKKKKNKDMVVQPYFILCPVEQPNLLQKGTYLQVVLGDRFNMALNKQNKIYKWGRFQLDFEEKLEDWLMNNQQNERLKETKIEDIQGLPQTYDDLDISFFNLSCTFNHAFAITYPGSDENMKREMYSWGYDGYTGRTGLGYVFKNPDQEDDEAQQKYLEIQRLKKKNLNELIDRPSQLQFLNVYLDFLIRLKEENMELMQQKIQQEDQQEDQQVQTRKKKLKTQKSATRISHARDPGEQLQLGKAGRKTIDTKIMIAAGLGLVKEKSIRKLTEEQFMHEVKPDLYKMAREDQKNIFNEKIINDIYEQAYQLNEENKKLYKDIKTKFHKEFKVFRNETQLTILKKIQSDPFGVKFQLDDKDKEDDKKKQEQPKKAKYVEFKQNRFSYKILFTLFQIHPCYLLNIYKKNLIKNPGDFILLVLDTFGDVQNDNRKSRIFISLALKILEFDMAGIISGEEEKPLNFDYNNEQNNLSYVFTRLYVSFQEQFVQNIQVNEKLIIGAEKNLDQIVSSMPKSMKENALAFLPEHFGGRFTKQDATQKKKFFDSQVDTIIDKFYSKFAIIPLLTTSNFAKPVKELFIKTYEFVKPIYLKKNMQDEKIQSKVMHLGFISFYNAYEKKAQKKNEQSFKDQKEQAEGEGEQ